MAVADVKVTPTKGWSDLRVQCYSHRGAQGVGKRLSHERARDNAGTGDARVNQRRSSAVRQLDRRRVEPYGGDLAVLRHSLFPHCRGSRHPREGFSFRLVDVVVTLGSVGVASSHSRCVASSSKSCGALV